MPEKKISRWPDKRKRIQQDAESLALKYGSSLPTNLKAMADERNVREIDFRPLLVDGTLSLRNDGFLVTIDCEEGEEEMLRDALAADPTGRSLPRRARFSIAHEIAHTFFFDLQDSPPR